MKMKLFKVKVDALDENLNGVFEENCPKIFGSKKKVENGVLNLLPAWPKFDLWGDVTIRYSDGEMSMEGSLGSSNPYDSNSLKLKKNLARPKTSQEMISKLKQWRDYQKKEFKQYVDNF